MDMDIQYMDALSVQIYSFYSLLINFFGKTEEMDKLQHFRSHLECKTLWV